MHSLGQLFAPHLRQRLIGVTSFLSTLFRLRWHNCRHNGVQFNNDSVHTLLQCVPFGAGLGRQLLGRIDARDREVVTQVLLKVLQIREPGKELVTRRIYGGFDLAESLL